jgi:hypothetical protein
LGTALDLAFAPEFLAATSARDDTLAIKLKMEELKKAKRSTLEKTPTEARANKYLRVHPIDN